MNLKKPVPTIYGSNVDKFTHRWAAAISKLQEKFPQDLIEIQMPDSGLVEIPTLTIKKSALIDVLSYCKSEDGIAFSFLTDVTAIDDGDDSAVGATGQVLRFQMVYLLMSLVDRARIRFKVLIEENESVPTISNLWIGANWAEREVFDMFGIKFDGHPDLRRIIMDQRWEGHPLRKDYPLRGYQTFITPEPLDPELLK